MKNNELELKRIRFWAEITGDKKTLDMLSKPSIWDDVVMEKPKISPEMEFKRKFLGEPVGGENGN